MSLRLETPKFSVRFLGLAAVAAIAIVAAPAAASLHAHGGGFRGAFFRPHAALVGLHPHVIRRFGLFGFGFAPGYVYSNYDAYYACFERVWGPFGWRLVYVCD